MMHITIDNQDRGILFYHKREKHALINEETGKEYTQEHPSSTVCSIFDGEDVVGTGISKVHPKDTFEYEKGRKYALGYALNDANLSKEERSQVWEQYHAR